MTNLEKLMAAGAENCHPKLIATVEVEPGKFVRCFVGEFRDDELFLTDEGRILLADKEPAPTAKRGKVKAALDDIDLE